MSSQRILLILILAGLVASSFIFNNEEFLSQNFLPQSKPKPNTTNNSPAFTISSLASKQYDENGNLRSIVKAKKLTSYPEQSKSLMDLAHIEFFEPNTGLVHWNMRAKRASTLSPNTNILLEDEVVLTRNKTSAQIAPATVYSDKMWIQTDTEIAHSKAQVKIISENNEINGTGFEARLNSTELSLHADVNSEYQSANDGTTAVWADEFFLDYQTGFARYEGNVTLLHNNITIKANRIDLKKSENKQLAYAYGEPARFEQESKVDAENIKAQAKRFEFDNIEEVLKMFDNAKLEQNKAIVEGDYLYYDTRSEAIGAESKEDKRVRMVLPPNNP